MNKRKLFKIGDRVICPAADQIPGTVIEVGYNSFTKVQYDDGVIGSCLASDLEDAPEQNRIGEEDNRD